MKKNPFRDQPTDDNRMEQLKQPSPSAEDKVLSRDLLTQVFRRTEQSLSPTGLHLFELLVVKQKKISDVMHQTGMSDSAV